MLNDVLIALPAGLALGCSYALLAVGFTLVFGVLRRINLAYGASIMTGLYGAIWLYETYSLSPLLLAPIVIAITLVAGVYVERLCFAPHGGRPDFIPMAASFAIWMQLQEIATLLLPQHSYAFPSLFGRAWEATAHIGVRLEHVLSLVSAVVVAVGVWLLLYRTRFGQTVRALSDNRQAAAYVGISVSRVSAMTFALSSVLGAIAGYLIVSVDGQITPMFAMWATLKGLIAAILGGLGSIFGAVVGGLMLGLLEMLLQTGFGPQYRDLASYVLLLILLAYGGAVLPRSLQAMTRPKGQEGR